MKYGSYESNGKWGCIDSKGEIVEGLRAKFENLSVFNDIIIINDQDKYGICDLSGNELVKPTYESALPFFSHAALVQDGNSWIFIDKKGKEISNKTSYSDVGTAGMYEYIMGISEQTVKSKYFDYDKAITSITSNLSAYGILGINFTANYNSLKNVIESLNKESLSISQNVYNDNSFRYIQRVPKIEQHNRSTNDINIDANEKAAREKSIADSIAAVNAYTYQNQYYNQQSEQINDPFPEIGTYQSYLRTASIIAQDGFSYQVLVRYNTNLKKAITTQVSQGYYTYERTTGYTINPEAKIIAICVNYSTNSDRREKVNIGVMDKIRSVGFLEKSPAEFLSPDNTTSILINSDGFCLTKIENSNYP